jgi:hypothetical protein
MGGPMTFKELHALERQAEELVAFPALARGEARADSTHHDLLPEKHIALLSVVIVRRRHTPVQAQIALLDCLATVTSTGTVVNGTLSRDASRRA